MSVALPEGAATSVRLDPLGRALIDGWQRGFPLVPRPYARIAEALGVAVAMNAGAALVYSARAMDAVGKANG